MANVTLGTLRDYWKALSDIIKTGGAATGTKGLQVAGSDGTNAQILKTNADGELITTLSGSNLPLVAGTAEIGKIKTDQTETLTTAPVTHTVTLTETPVSLNSKSNLKQITVRNVDKVIRARIGETGMTPANGKGFALEPLATYQETFDPSVPVIIYGRSEGTSIQVEVYEV